MQFTPSAGNGNIETLLSTFVIECPKIHGELTVEIGANLKLMAGWRVSNVVSMGMNSRDCTALRTATTSGSVPWPKPLLTTQKPTHAWPWEKRTTGLRSAAYGAAARNSVESRQVARPSLVMRPGPLIF